MMSATTTSHAVLLGCDLVSKIGTRGHKRFSPTIAVNHRLSSALGSAVGPPCDRVIASF
jgi:hypothetical protein